ncbi:MAG: hypothetical protein A3G81_02645 [Betaproteobacteria bacterium RIFCSPLOWO2_12_FULL_65_14]|nr:MAG: hypothetical protein A3G81_02645 [Betaproteobacteria bacterium RIFCSPLOWO2_12_FULL_65_14]
MSRLGDIALTFLGAAGTVTGSRCLLEADGRRHLVDCGLFQGLKALRLRNWARFPVDPRSIESVVLTHAHIDHSGYLPVLSKNGFAGKVHASRATRELCAILLSKRRAVLRALLALIVALPFAGRALAQEMGFRKNVGEFWVYLAVMPAELLTGPSAPQAPGATPYQAPAVRDTHHVMVSIFEYRTGRRVEEASVAARVAELGFSGAKKTLEPIVVAGEKVYGGRFPMLGRGPYRVDVEFRLPGAVGPEHGAFYFTHPSFAPPEAAR